MGWLQEESTAGEMTRSGYLHPPKWAKWGATGFTSGFTSALGMSFHPTNTRKQANYAKNKYIATSLHYYRMGICAGDDVPDQLPWVLLPRLIR
ncbi:hypothetical protein N7466_004012 [Penicillium verhagenii]|uniref:uncharacterized protein n=1 Tax=Penicillium verhagenii TaxID=1562060 RepID=UPI00254595C7|nr:uncharacterized protein N7466_004012 [Penicillium verhagenii]KAJ5934465.1 hypothetical protein N7466_004012 [Penicillium verhagenii]